MNYDELTSEEEGVASFCLSREQVQVLSAMTKDVLANDKAEKFCKNPRAAAEYIYFRELRKAKRAHVEQILSNVTGRRRRVSQQGRARMRKTDDKILIESMRILSRDIVSGDGVANAAILEAADRLQELSDEEAANNQLLALQHRRT